MSEQATQPSRERRCHKCGYSLEGLTIDRPCPECGTVSPVSQMRFTGRLVRRWWLGPLLVVVGIVSIELANLTTGWIIDMLRASIGRRGPGAPSPILLLCGIPLTPIILLVSYLQRLGEEETWTMEEDRLTVRRHKHIVIAAWRYRDLGKIRRDPGSPLSKTLELLLRGRERPVRRMRSELDLAITFELCDILNERIELARARASEEPAQGATPAIALQTTHAVPWPRVLFRCPVCGKCRTPKQARHACVCGGPGLPDAWHLIPVAGYCLDERDVRVATTDPNLVDWMDFRLRSLPVRPFVLALASLLGATLIGLIDYSIRGLDMDGGFILVGGIAVSTLLHVLFGAEWAGTRALLLVRPDRFELLTPEWSREFSRQALMNDSRWVSVARSDDETISLVLSAHARRALRKALSRAIPPVPE